MVCLCMHVVSEAIVVLAHHAAPIGATVMLCTRAALASLPHADYLDSGEGSLWLKATVAATA